MTEDPWAGYRAAAAYLPRFEAPGFGFGAWVRTSAASGGSASGSHYALSDTAQDFVETCFAVGLVEQGFDWPSWKSTPEARALFGDPKLIADATAGQVSHLLTTIIRSDRFDEGALGRAYESGLLTRILRRAETLSRSGPGQ